MSTDEIAVRMRIIERELKKAIAPDANPESQNSTEA
jgi:hypothetical protein